MWKSFFSWNPETSLLNLPLSNGTGNGIDETWQETHVRRMLCVNHLFYQIAWFCAFGGRGRYKIAGMFEVNLAFYWFIVHSYTEYGHFVVQWDAHSPEVSMNIQTAKVCIPWFAILSISHPNFLQNIFLCCWNDSLSFYRHYSFCTVFWSAAFI